DGNGSHASTLKSPSYTKSVSWQHYLESHSLMKLMQIQSVKYRFTTLTFFDYFLKKAKYYCPDAIINPPFDSG
ncbi:hypothetical protein, partial [Shigella flexneri]